MSLSPLLAAEKPDGEKAAIGEAELAEAWEAMAEVVQSFDYDSLQYMIGELDGYSLPVADKEKLAKIKQAASVPDRETLKRILY